MIVKLNLQKLRKMNYSVSFDVELDRLVPESWNSVNVPQITCAAVHSESGGTKVFFTRTPNGISPKLSKTDASALLDELWIHSQLGAVIISWGGTVVDFRALFYALSGDSVRQLQCSHLVRTHVDVTIASSTDMGIMFGLDAAAKGTGQGRKNNLTSLDAPRMWTSGEHDAVIEHVKLDAILTLKVYNSLMTRLPPTLTWETKSGRMKTWVCFVVADYARNIIRLCTVEECMMRPPKQVLFEIPDGMNRDKAVSWIWGGVGGI